MMKTWTMGILLAVGVAVSLPNLAQAATAAELLEKGIYNQETVGNLDKAIEIYREILESTSETERLAAQAQFRLGQCLLKQNKKTEATAAFRTVLSKYPAQKEIVAKAQKFLPGLLNLIPAPWKTGEHSTLTMKLPGGHTIGMIGVSINDAKEGGRDAWKMHIRRYVVAGQNEGVSHILVDKATNRPIKTLWQHTVLGNANAVWHDDKVVIKKQNSKGEWKESTVKFSEPSYANDQWFYGFRRLPLKVGYEVTIPLRIAFTGGNGVDLEIKVDGKEKIKTPLGEFDCFRLETNIQQTFWVADTKERQLVQFVGGGVEAKLTSFNVGDKATRITSKQAGLSFELPKGWCFHEINSDKPGTSEGYRLAAPNMSSALVRVRDKTMLSDDLNTTRAWVEDRIEDGKKAFKGFRVRDGIQSAKMAGLDAESITADHKVQKSDVVRTMTLAIGDKYALEIGTTSQEKDFAKDKTILESLRESISLR